jgi:hypothetical protein
MGTVIQDIRTAIKTQIEAAGITCRKYEPWDVSKTPLATLSLRSADTMDQPDQKYGWRRLSFDIYLYQIVDANAEQSMAYQDANVAKALTGLGADRTLGNKCRSSDIERISFDVVRLENGAVVSMCVIEFHVIPHPNVA